MLNPGADPKGRQLVTDVCRYGGKVAFLVLLGSRLRGRHYRKERQNNSGYHLEPLNNKHIKGEFCAGPSLSLNVILTERMVNTAPFSGYGDWSNNW